MSKDYFKNMDIMFCETNHKSLSYGDGRAWDNKKIKTMRLQAPRGKAYRRLCNMRWKATCEYMLDVLSESAMVMKASEKIGRNIMMRNK